MYDMMFCRYGQTYWDQGLDQPYFRQLFGAIRNGTAFGGKGGQLDLDNLVRTVQAADAGHLTAPLDSLGIRGLRVERAVPPCTVTKPCLEHNGGPHWPMARKKPHLNKSLQSHFHSL